MSLTAHQNDSEWKLHKIILNFCQVSNHMGEIIGLMIENCLLEWGVITQFLGDSLNYTKN